MSIRSRASEIAEPEDTATRNSNGKRGTKCKVPGFALKILVDRSLSQRLKTGALAREARQAKPAGQRHGPLTPLWYLIIDHNHLMGPSFSRPAFWRPLGRVGSPAWRDVVFSRREPAPLVDTPLAPPTTGILDLFAPCLWLYHWCTSRPYSRLRSSHPHPQTPKDGAVVLHRKVSAR